MLCSIFITQKVISQKNVNWNYFTFNIPEHWKAEENPFKTYQIYRLFEDKGQQNWLLINIKEQKESNLDTILLKYVTLVKENSERIEIKKSERSKKNKYQIHHLETYDTENKVTELFNFIELNEKVYREWFWYDKDTPKQFVTEGLAIFNSISLNNQIYKEPLLKRIIKAPKRFVKKLLIIIQVRKVAKIMKKTSEKI